MERWDVPSLPLGSENSQLIAATPAKAVGSPSGRGESVNVDSASRLHKMQHATVQN